MISPPQPCKQPPARLAGARRTTWTTWRGGWLALRRRVAQALCALLFLEAAPALAEEALARVQLRPEPLGWSSTRAGLFSLAEVAERAVAPEISRLRVALRPPSARNDSDSLSRPQGKVNAESFRDPQASRPQGDIYAQAVRDSPSSRPQGDRDAQAARDPQSSRPHGEVYAQAVRTPQSSRPKGGREAARSGEISADRTPVSLPAIDAPPTVPGFSRAALAAGTSAPPPFVSLAATAALDLTVLPGWNLVSLPTTPAVSTPAAVFAPLGAALHQAYTYDACDPSDPWKLYDPASPATSDLTSLDERNGVWVDATAAAVLPADPAGPPAVTTIHLCPGWNLIGYPASQARPVTAALQSIAGKYRRVWGYDATDTANPNGSGWAVYSTDVPAYANSLALLEPGRGYWVLATAETDLTIQNASDELVVDLTAPADLAEVTKPTPVIGTVSGSGLVSWTLRSRMLDGATGDDGWTTLAASGSQVTAGTLAGFDPTLRQNGLHELELAAEDVNGEVTVVSRTLRVAGQMKIGLFTLSFVDLEVALSGLPIQLVRTYDSRLKVSRDFGHGWTLEVRSGSVRHNRPPGRSWSFASGIVPCQFALEGLAHETVVRLSDREIYRFRPRVNHPVPDFGGCVATIDYVFVDGPAVGVQLQILGENQIFWPNGGRDLLLADSQEVFEPRQVRLVTRDGRSFDLDAGLGVTHIADPNGNELTITPTSISHSSGESISLARDGAGRITAVTDPESRQLTYAYDGAGDLVGVTDRTAQTTQFTYDGDHGLLTIVDPRGITPLRNEYDASGRLIRHTDAYGNTIELAHDLTGQSEVVTDRLAHSRTLEYDDRGNVVRETDSLGKVTTRSFDGNDQLLSETDPLGHTTSYGYDANRNLTSTSDPLGNVTGFTYDAKGNVLATTDPRGKVTTNTYDATGNLLTTRDPLGHVSTNTYDTRGNLLTSTDPAGAVARYAYDGRGNLSSETDALGTVTTSTFDRNGNRLTQSTTRTVPAAGGGTTTETLAWSYGYDANGRLLASTNPDGSTSSTAYDPLGNVLSSTDALGHTTSFTYDLMGRLTATHYADGTGDGATYDAEGRRLTSTDRGGRTTSYAYDFTGRLLATTMADGATVASAYDDAGRLVTSTDARGFNTTYVYDAAGRRTSVSDALGQVTSFVYDAAGSQTRVTDARGNATQYTYDDAGRLVTTTYADGTTTSTGYDLAGRRISETDQAGVTTSFGYDAVGRLTSVTDALNGVTTYDYDEQGNRVSQTDANGHTTRFEYDVMGRQLARVLPDGARESVAFDAGGRRTARTDFRGRTTTYGYDIAGRLVSRTYPAGGGGAGGAGDVVSFTYTATGRRATAVDARGTTTYGYDSRDRLTTLAYPDGRELRFGYDVAGNRTSLTAVLPGGGGGGGGAGATLTTSYAYDALGRLETVTDPGGRVYVHGYDANGSRASLTHPNGVRTDYTYDLLNRLTGIVALTGAAGGGGGVGTTVQSFAYTLGAAGNRTRVVEAGSGAGTTKDYTYDALYRLTDEQVTVSGAGTIRWRNGFTYDAVGNRTAQTRVAAAGGGTPQVVGYGYDERDRLLSEDAGVGAPVAYGWDANGDLTAKTAADGANYEWDFDDRLASVTLADGSVVRHTYDVDGVRVRTEVTLAGGGAAVVTEYLVDTSGPLSQVVVEGPTVGEVGALYVRGDDLLAVVRPAGGGGGGEVVRYPHADGLGSVRALTDEAGAVTDRYDYEAFGQLAAREGTDPQPYLFAGESLDPNSGWYYNRARWMDPSVGRFGSVDPWLGNASDPTSLHRYSYAASDPTNRSDPSGRFSTPELLMTALLVGLFASAFYGIRTALAGGSVGKIAKAEAEWFVRGALIGATVYAVLWGGVVVYVGLATGGVTYSPQVYDAYRAGRAYVVTLDRATTVYRYTGYGGGLAGQSLSGQWWTTVLYSGSGQAIEELALPASNTATYVFSGVVPAGTQILVGEAAPLFGRVGGGVQIYLSGPLAMNFLGTLP